MASWAAIPRGYFTELFRRAAAIQDARAGISGADAYKLARNDLDAEIILNKNQKSFVFSDKKV